MRLIGALASGETATADQQTDALTALNSMIGVWSTEQLLIWAKVSEDFTLVPSQQSYTFGTGGNFNSTRPQKIENAYLVTGTSPNVFEIPVDIVNQDQWASITVKTTQSAIPQRLYNDTAYPLSNIYLWPIPNAANTLRLYSWKPLSSFSTADSTVDLPPGYEEALRYNLAVRLAPEYGRPILPQVQEIAVGSKAAIKRMNTKFNLLISDDALLQRVRTFNWLTGE